MSILTVGPSPAPSTAPMTSTTPTPSTPASVQTADATVTGRAGGMGEPPDPASDPGCEPRAATLGPRGRSAGSPSGVEPVNQVRLVGRISAIADPHVLPSGDSVVAVRVVVPRGPDAGHHNSKVSVDTLDVACWAPDTQRQALAIGVDGWAEVIGSIRRRFFRTAHGPASRYEIEAHDLARVHPPHSDRAAAPSDAPGEESGGRFVD